MNKIVFRRTGGAEVLERVEEADPHAGPGEVVVRAEAIAVGWPDILMRTGTYRWMPPLPVTPGTEMAGRVESVGPGVRTLQVGDAVYVSSRELGFKGGCYAERMCVPETSVFKLPLQVEVAHAAGLGYYALAHILLFEIAAGQKMRRVLVSGAAGGMGIALVQVARAAGIEVIGTVSSDAKAAFAQRAGAQHTIDYKRENVKDRVAELTHGEGVDRIIDAVVGPRFIDNIDMLAPWGQAVIYNWTAGPPPPDFFQQWMTHSARVPGLHCFSMHVYETDPVGRRRVVQAALDLLAAGSVKPPAPTWYRLADAAQAQRDLEGGANLGRLFLRP